MEHYKPHYLVATLDVDALIYLALGEADLVHELVNNLISHARRLLHSVKRTFYLSRMVRIISINKSIRLLQEEDIFFKDTVDKCRLDIHLVKHEVMLRGDAENDSDRRALGHRSESVLQILTISLQANFCHEAGLGALNTSINSLLTLNTHFLLIALRSLGNDASSHVLFLHND